MSNKDKRKQDRRKAQRDEAERMRVDRTGGGGGIDLPERISHAQLDTLATMPSVARTHAADCNAVFDPLSQCSPECETDAQLRKRLQDRFG